MRFISLMILTSFSCAIFYAQEREVLVDDFIEQDVIRKDPYIAFKQNTPNFTTTNLSYSIRSNKFKRVQVGEKENHFDFQTYGIYKISKNIIISGKIGFNRITEKNVAYTLDDSRTDGDNFTIKSIYYYIGRKGDWLKQNYNLEGIVAYRFLNNFIAQLSIEGIYNENFRNIDPRPKVANVNYYVLGKLGYKTGHHHFLVSAGYLNKDKNLDIYYHQNELNNFNVSPETLLRINEGYGNNYIAGVSVIKNLYKNKGQVLGGEYAYLTDKFLVRLGYQNVYSLTKNYDDFYENPYRKIFALKEEGHRVFFDFQKKYEHLVWNTQMDAKYSSFLNYNYLKEATSNKQEQIDVVFRNLLISKNNRETDLYGVNFYFKDFYSKDLSVVLDKRITAVGMNLLYGKSFFVNERSSLFFNIDNDFYLPIRQKFEYTPYHSTSENVFVVKIASPDHYYDSSYRYSPNLEIGFRKKTKLFNWQATINVQQTFFVKNNTFKIKIMDTNSNLNLLLGLKVFY